MNGPDAEESLFYFESDHLALRGNEDYSALLRTLVILESQRAQLVKQIEELNVQKNYYLKHHDEFLKKIRDGTLENPPQIVIAEIPEIDFSKYNTKLPESPRAQPSESSSSEDLWTSEEETKLEELLLEFPPQKQEMQRYEKIAKALGNRTVQQVASKVRKYFQQLNSAGLPVPGRIPKARKRFHFLRKTTIRPAHVFPSSQASSAPNDKNSRIIAILQAIKEAKNKFRDYVKHEGSECSLCSESPVVGIRWNCSHRECVRNSIDFCSDCLVDQLVDESKRHPLHHDFVAFGDCGDEDFETEEYF